MTKPWKLFLELTQLYILTFLVVIVSDNKCFLVPIELNEVM